MKFKVSKKLIVSSLASVMAVSLVGAVTGTVAWYQYNTRVTTSLIGLNVAETGVLDISATSATAGFTRDLTTKDLVAGDARVTPITWATGANQTATSALSGAAYKNPNASLNRVAADAGEGHGAGKYADVFQAATSSDYVQFTVYLRGRTVNDVDGGLELTAEKVYLTDFTLTEVDGTIIDGLRVHLACYNNSTSGTADKNYLISNTARTNLPLSGKLDCDADGIADRIGGYEWLADRDTTVTYGEAYTQTTMAKASLINAPGANDVITDDNDKLLVTTPTAENSASKIVVTIWMEGWDTLQTKSVKSITASTPTNGTDVSSGYYTDRNATVAATGNANGSTVYYQSENVNVPMWSGEDTDGAHFRLGMTFAVSSDAFLN